MTFRLGIWAALSSVLLPGSLFPQNPASAKERDSGWIATIQVQVRDSRGLPISGLGRDDFILSEHGTRDAIVSVRSLAEPAAITAPQFETPSQGETSKAQPESRQTSPQRAFTNTWILLVFAPMSAQGRNLAISGLQKFLNQSHPDNFRFALLDDAGEFLPFSQDTRALRSRLDFLEHHTSPPQFYGGPWMSKTGRAIQELAIRPGRHAIVFASDFESNVSDPIFINPYRPPLRVGPSAFVGAAVYAQAAMYTVEGSGPGVVVPFGGAAEFQYSGSGQQVADMINMQTTNLAERRRDFLYAAEQTGGVAARDILDAFADIAADAAGFYRITFKPNLEETDGAWHPISVSIPGRNVRIRGPRYYLAPLSESQQKLPAEMLKKFQNRAATAHLDSAAHVWLFPDAEGIHTALMAADFAWPATANNSPRGSQLQIFAQLVDDSLGQVVGSWLREQEWKQDDKVSRSVHWQRETPLYPGLYSLRVIALDTASGRMGTREFTFAIYPTSTPPFRLSDIVISGRCLADDEVQGRTNLLDPLLVDGCFLSPSAAGSFSTAQTPTVMVRIYTTDQELREMILRDWKGYVSIGEGQRIPLSIARADIRGLVVSGQLDFSKLNLKAGPNPILVDFETTLDDGNKYLIGLRSQLTVTP